MAENYDYKIAFNVLDNGKTNIKINRSEFDFRNDLKIIKKEVPFEKKDFEYFNGKLIEYNIDLFEFLGLDENFDFSTIGSFSGEFFFYKNHPQLLIKKNITIKIIVIEMVSLKNLVELKYIEIILE